MSNSILQAYDVNTHQYVAIPTLRGEPGPSGRSILSIIRTSGTGQAGSTDVYTITYSDATTSTFTVYNGSDGGGAGDMLKATYDSDNDGVVDNAERVNSHTVNADVPSGLVMVAVNLRPLESIDN